jgi:dienelactone hydrolase
VKRRDLFRAAAALPFAAMPLPADTVSRRAELYALLGDLPPRDRPIAARTVSVEERPTYLLEKVVLDLNGFEPVPGYFVKPKKAAGIMPAVLFNHSHGGHYEIAKQEFVRGREYLANPPYAEFLTSRGYCALCVDMWCFGERATRTETDAFKEMLWNGQVLWGKMVYDSLRALDYLASRPETDPSRIATVGISMGSSMAQWVSALDDRINVTVDICDLTDYQALIAAHNLQGHGVYYFVPSLLKHFTAGQINALIAPRAHLSLAGNQDGLTPSAGLDRIDGELKQVYAAAGHPGNWKLLRYDGGHQETDVMRREITAFFAAHL